MKRFLVTAAALLTLAGCAGGWRNGPPPGYAGPGTPASLVPGGSPEVAAVTAPAAATAKPGAGKAAAAGNATAETAGGVRFVWTGGGGGASVAGEFNGWNPTADPMEKQGDGSFVLVKPLAPGRYAYKFVVDGTDWKADPTATESVDDGFGGKNSVVVVTGTAAGAAPAAPAAPKPAAPAAAPAAGAGPRETADGVRFTWTGGGGSVNLAGEFNGWSTSEDAMQKQADGSFTILKKLAPGRYPYKFVVDGTTWKEDPAAAEFVDDGFGGKNSVVVVTGTAAGAAPAAPAAPKPAPKPAAGSAAGAGPRETADGVRFTWTGGGGSVNLAGEFNAWSTSEDAMQKQADGSFTVLKKLAPGRYAYKFVVDGTTWKEDPAAAEFADDGFGGKNSVVVVTGTGGGDAPKTVSAPAAAAPAAVPVTGRAKPPAVGADGVTFTFAQQANSVHLAGDFNGWSTTTDPLARQADGTWTITKKLPAGTHAYKFVVNGTTWKQDEANPESSDDGFGGKNSVVTVK